MISTCRCRPRMAEPLPEMARKVQVASRYAGSHPLGLHPKGPEVGWKHGNEMQDRRLRRQRRTRTLACESSFTDSAVSDPYRRDMLGDELRKARLKAGLTQEQVAAQARISREYVSQLERNRQSPTVDMLLRVCAMLKVSASRLIAKVEKADSGGRPVVERSPLRRR